MPSFMMREYPTVAVELLFFHRVWISAATIYLVMTPAFLHILNANALPAYGWALVVIVIAMILFLILAVMVNAQKRHTSIMDCITSAAGVPAALYSAGIGLNMLGWG